MNLKEKVTIIDWVLYIILCIVACCFIVVSDVIQKYLNENTDTYETEIQLKEFTPPAFMFCDYSGEILGLEYDIIYELTNENLGTITKVENFTKYSLFEGQCFIITPPQHEMDFTHTILHNIQIRFNASTPLNYMPQFIVYVNSKNNPELYRKFYDGNPMIHTMNHQENAFFAINEVRTEYLPENCRTEPILEFLASEFVKQDGNCSTKCHIITHYPIDKAFDDKLKDWPVCKDDKAIQCMIEWGRNIIRNAKHYCHKISYTGRMHSFHIQENDSWCSQVTSIKLEYLSTHLIQPFYVFLYLAFSVWTLFNCPFLLPLLLQALPLNKIRFP